MNDKTKEFEMIASEANVGHLGLVTSDGYPRVIPVNFVTLGTLVYFHGATDGEKYDELSRNPKVTFGIDLPYAMIPSYWRSPEYACPATQYFKSALVKGRAIIVTDPAEKVTALQALMEKHQPEGGFRRINSDDQMYRRAVEEVAIFRIDPDQVSTRIEFGQTLTAATRERVIGMLRERGEGRDLATANEMEQAMPTSDKDE